MAWRGALGAEPAVTGVAAIVKAFEAIAFQATRIMPIDDAVALPTLTFGGDTTIEISARFYTPPSVYSALYHFSNAFVGASNSWATDAVYSYVNAANTYVYNYVYEGTTHVRGSHYRGVPSTWIADECTDAFCRYTAILSTSRNGWFYHNGVLRYTHVGAFIPKITRTANVLGACVKTSQGFGNNFHGELAAFAIYDYLRTPQEAEDDAATLPPTTAATAPPDPAGPKYRWRLTDERPVPPETECS